MRNLLPTIEGKLCVELRHNRCSTPKKIQIKTFFLRCRDFSTISIVLTLFMASTSRAEGIFVKAIYGFFGNFLLGSATSLILHFMTTDVGESIELIFIKWWAKSVVLTWINKLTLHYFWGFMNSLPEIVMPFLFNSVSPLKYHRTEEKGKSEKLCKQLSQYKTCCEGMFELNMNAICLPLLRWGKHFHAVHK